MQIQEGVKRLVHRAAGLIPSVRRAREAEARALQLRQPDASREAPRWIGDAAKARSRVSEARARRLLVRLLNPQQVRELDKHGCFTVNVRGRGTFCILPRSTFNVIHLQKGNLYCCTTEAFMPLSDLMLAQKLLLENDPDRFFASANVRPETFAGPQEQLLRHVLIAEAA